MSDAIATEAAASEHPAMSAGALLRQAREAAGLHVATLAVSLKVPVRKLEALEEDRHEELPDAVFARGLAASVCRTLKIDPQPILERLPQGRAKLRSDDGMINAPFRAPSDGPPPRMVDQLTRPVGLAVLALLLGAVVIIFLPTLRRDNAESASASAPAAAAHPGVPAAIPAEPSASAPPMVAEALPAATPASASGATPVAAASSPAAASPVPAARTAASAASASARGASAPTASTSSKLSATVAFTPAAAASAAAANEQPVAFRARGTSWVQVTDAKGAVVMQRLLNAGDSASAAGTLPLNVIVGSADATEVQVRGKPYELRGLVRDNVARFQVK